LVRAFSGLPPLRPEPPAASAGLCLAGGRAAVPGLTFRASRPRRLSSKITSCARRITLHEFVLRARVGLFGVAGSAELTQSLD
jgi:hypothetical protein